MASMKFIVEEDMPKRFEVKGDLFDILGMVSYQVGSIYRMLSSQSAVTAEMFREMLGHLVSDPKSPAWSLGQLDGAVEIAMCFPNHKDGENPTEQNEEDLE